MFCHCVSHQNISSTVIRRNFPILIRYLCKINCSYVLSFWLHKCDICNIPLSLGEVDCPSLFAIFSSSPGFLGGSLPCGCFPGTIAPVARASSSTLEGINKYNKWISRFLSKGNISKILYYSSRNRHWYLWWYVNRTRTISVTSLLIYRRRRSCRTSSWIGCIKNMLR